MGNCGCVGARPFVEEVKLWLPLIIVSALAVGIPIAVGADVAWTLIGYGIYCSIWILMGLCSNCFFNYGVVPAYVQSDRNLEGCTAIVTGANSGSGYCTARELVKRGAHVIITCRNQKKVDATIQSITAELKNEKNIGKLDYAIADLCSKKSIDSAIEAIKSKNLEINILINNAGAVLPTKNLSEDGLLPMWEANYLAPFYMTKKLLPIIKEAARKRKYGRIVNVASIAHMSATIGNIEGWISKEKRGDLDFWKGAPNAYGDTKLAQILYAQKLQEILDSETDSDGNKVGDYLYVTSLQPGYINSGFYNFNENGPLIRFGWLMVYPFQAVFGMVTPNQGAQTSLHCALSDNHVKPGGYHGHCRPQPLKSGDEINAKKDQLYEVTDAIWAEDA